MGRSRALLRSAAVLLWWSLLAASASADGPEQAYARLQAPIAEERWNVVYDGLSRRSQQAFEDAMIHVAQHMKAIGIPADRAPSARESFIRVVPKNAQLRALFEAKEYSVSSVDRMDGEAILRVLEKGETESRAVRMVEEARLWKLEVDL